MAGMNGQRFSLLALLLTPREHAHAEQSQLRQKLQSVPLQLRELTEAIDRGELCPGDLLDSEDEEVAPSPRPVSSERPA
jgi:hypothetical protein